MEREHAADTFRIPTFRSGESGFLVLLWQLSQAKGSAIEAI